ncbi:hypothetical protein J7I91_21590 [Pseudomonas sp. ISL-84]|nr:hypothetical protein [Pseudomonas sp. ISL-84]
MSTTTGSSFVNIRVLILIFTIFIAVSDIKTIVGCTITIINILKTIIFDI